jgi:hypothetical protein
LGGIVFPIIVILLLAVLGVEGWLLARPKTARPQEALEAIAQMEGQGVETFGDPSAQIQIEFYAPLVLEWHQKTIGLLREYDDSSPGRIHVSLMPMGHQESDTDMHNRGYSCAVILINDENEFTLPDGRTVALHKRPNQATSTYDSEDVITILDQLAAGAS